MAFAVTHARALAAELNKWQDKGELGDGRLQELAQICAKADPNDSMSLAESIAQRAIRDAVAQPAALPEKFAAGREPWRVYDDGVGVTTRCTQAAAGDIDLKIVCWPGRDAERAELARWLCEVLNGAPMNSKQE
jgi:hypothetical protein